MLRPCPACRRHVVATELACPFCGLALSPPAPRPIVNGRFSRAAVFAGATLAGCWTGNEPATTPIEQHPVEEHHAEEHHAEEHHVGRRDPADTQLATIGGTLTETSTGQPASNIQVQLISRASQKVQTVQTDLAGHYIFTSVEPGDYEIVWDITGNPRRSPRRLGVHVAEGAQMTFDLTMTFMPQHTMPMPYGAPPARKRIV